MENPLLHNAIESVRLGFYDDARGLLLQIIRQDSDNVLAWLWLAQTLDDPKRQMDCLRQVQRIEPGNPDALAGVKALRTGMSLPEPGGGIVTPPELELEPAALEDMFGWGTLFTGAPESKPVSEPELAASEDMFGWGALYAEEPESELSFEPETIVLDDTFGWGALLYDGEPAPESAPEPAAVTPDDALGWGALYDEEPEPAPAPVKKVTLPAPAVVVDVASEAPAEETAPPAPVESESFLHRARRMRSQASAPVSAPVFTEIPFSGAPQITAAPASPEPEIETLEPAPASARKFRLFDRRVLFSILGLLQLPLVIGLLVLLLRGRAVSLPDDDSTAAPPLARPASRACRSLDLDEFVTTDSLGGELTVDTVFTATQGVITETLVVPDGLRLLIYPGATLVFSREATLEVYGALYACGNEAAPITFTALEKSPGGWEGIRLYNPVEASVFSHAVIEYAGARALYLLNSVPVLTDLAIQHSALFPISLDGSLVPDLSKNVVLSDNPINGIEVRPGTLKIANAVWHDAKVVYVVSGLLRVDAGATLDIQPGVVVKFWHAPNGQVPGIWVHGLLKADGATFTSLYDSSAEAGGVTYLEAVDPQPGDWGSLTFYESSEKSYLRTVMVRYGGQGRAAVAMQASSPELTKVTIADAAGYPLSADAHAFPALNNLTLTGNAGGDALELRGDMTISGPEARAWERLGGATPIARIVRDTVTVGPDAKLTVHPGVVVKFAEQGQLVVKGALSAVGGSNPEEQIIFTSIYDAEYGGDTGGALVPRDKWGWGGILIERADVISEFHNVQVRYAMLTLQDASPTLYSSLIAFAPGPGLRMTPGSSPDLRATRFQGNAVQGIAIVTGTMTSEQRWAQLGATGDEPIVRILEGEVVVGPDASLTIDAGAIIKAGPAGKLTVLGQLHAAGHKDRKVIFTSLQDDSFGGDTNRSLLGARAGDWPGVEIAPEGFARLAYLGIYYAQVGLTARGAQLPVIETGSVHIAYSKRPLSCTARVQIPAAFLFEDNEVEVKRCPSP